MSIRNNKGEDRLESTASKCTLIRGQSLFQTSCQRLYPREAKSDCWYHSHLLSTIGLAPARTRPESEKLSLGLPKGLRWVDHRMLGELY
jgi:hypothetical protein